MENCNKIFNILYKSTWDQTKYYISYDCTFKFSTFRNFYIF